jgi:hypothetical protein
MLQSGSNRGERKRVRLSVIKYKKSLDLEIMLLTLIWGGGVLCSTLSRGTGCSVCLYVGFRSHSRQILG